MKIDQGIMEILEKSTLDGALLRLPPAQLDRATYAAVNKVIEAAGGRWNRKARAHVFEGDAMDTVEPILLTGEYTRIKQDFGQFDTPPAIASIAIERCQIMPGMKLLEPSAGNGALALPASLAGAVVFGYEVDPKRYAKLMSGPPFYPDGGCGAQDFLTVEPAPVFDRVLMNPPFAKQADIAHVRHAAKFLKTDGRLVAIMSASVTFRTDAKTEAFRAYINSRGAEHENLPAGAFKESGTMVNAIIVSFGGGSGR